MYNTLKITNRVVSGVDYTVFEAGNYTVAVDDATRRVELVNYDGEVVKIGFATPAGDSVKVSTYGVAQVDPAVLVAESEAAFAVVTAVNAHTAALADDATR